MFLEKYLEPLNSTAENIKTLLSATNPQSQRIVEKGLLLYRQGFVSQVRFDQFLVTGVVQDVTRVKVSINLDFVQLSNCSCLTEGFCRHQLAVFFYLLGQVGKVSSWLENWREPIPSKQSLHDLHLMKASDLLEKKEKEHSYESWIAIFEEHFQETIESTSQKPYMIAEMYYTYMRKIKYNAPLQQEWKLLYLLIGYIYTYNRLLTLSQSLEHHPDTINRYYRHLFHDLLADTENTLTKMGNFTFPFAFDQYLHPLKKMTVDMLSIQPFILYETIQMFRVLWTHLFTRKEWRVETLASLNKHEEHSFSEAMAIAHLQILVRKDHDALQTIQTHPIDSVPYMLYWFDFFNGRREWQRMEDYMQYFTSYLQEYIQLEDDHEFSEEFTRLSIRAIKPYCQAKNSMDILEKTYATTLPYSFKAYEDFLYTNKQYDKWTDLLLYMQIDIDQLYNEQIKNIQAYSPSLLLSFYHQAIQAHIDHKSRDHYRLAVRHLKKLRTLYKKLKKQSEFDQFIQLLVERTKRLRAFHEELKKGKLIHAEK